MDPWITEWNDIIRDVFFADAELKSLMKIPDSTTIIEFVENYFIRAGYTGKLLTNQSVRIVYGIVGNNYAGQNPNVVNNTLSFDIYVKTEDQRNATNDRLVYRNQLIANRLRYLLMNQQYLGGYRFRMSKESDMGTSTVGYTRYCISFAFKRVY